MLSSKKTVSALFTIFGGVYAFGIAQSPLSYSIIDRDGSNVISVLELIDSFDVGTRESGNCLEYYWLKDGLTAYEYCDHPN